jgi:hypothetical protein
MVLFVVPVQLSLFPMMVPVKWTPFRASSRMREKRTARQWIDSIAAYCEWRAGEPWRRLSDPEQRWDHERWDYLDAARTVRDAFFEAQKPKGPYLALPALNVAPPPLPSELKLSRLPRKALVDALLRENPKLTDRKLLMKLKCRKLAHMLAAVRLESDQAEPERMRA